MKTFRLFLLILCVGIVGCNRKTNTDINANADTVSNTDKAATADAIPIEYQSVIDSILNSQDKVSSLDSEYFLYDITGDEVPELWVSIGTCEADTKLLAFTITDGKSRKIYDGEGGHSDYFIYHGELVCVMCNTGSGAVITFEYDGNHVGETAVGFSTWNDEGKPLSQPYDSITDAKLNYWEDNYEKYIELKPL